MIAMLLLLAVLGVCAYLIESAPMSPPFKVAFQFLCLIFAIALILRAFGIVDIPVPQLRR